MSFRLVSSGGTTVQSPAFVNMPASGVVHPGGVVEFVPTTSLTAQGYVAPASSSSTFTTIFGVAVDYAQGNSDTFVNVIPFASGQLWEGDCISAGSTIQVGKRHALSNATTPERSRLLQNTSYDNSSASGIFLVYALSNASGSGKVIGEFIRSTRTGISPTTFF